MWVALSQFSNWHSGDAVLMLLMHKLESHAQSFCQDVQKSHSSLASCNKYVSQRMYSHGMEVGSF